MRIAILILGPILGLLALIAPAAAQPRALPVPIGKGWQHADSGVILTAALAGLPRTTLTDNGVDERDIAADFASADRATVATVYIFKPALMSVPIWFDRAQTEIALRDIDGGATPVAPFPTPFARPGGSVRSGLRQVYVPGHGRYRSTAAATVPVGTWIVAIRLRSTMLDPGEADVKLSAIVAAIRWPSVADVAPVARPVGDCTDALAFHQATPMNPDMMQSLLGGALAASAEREHPVDDAPVTWCRDPVAPTAAYGVYRIIGAGDGYTLALGDSGRIISVYKAMTVPGETSTGGYAVSMTDLDGSTATFRSFDGLPQPQQVFDMVLRGRPVIARRDRGDGTNVSVGLPK